MNTSAIILASGFSRRMGQDKLLFMYENKPLAAHVLDAVTHAHVEERIIVTNDPRLVVLAEGFIHVDNPEAGEGIAAAVRAGVRTASGGRYIFLVADQPFITAAMIDDMVGMSDRNTDRIVTAAADGRRGNPVLFPGAYRGKLLELRGDAGGRVIMDREPERVVTFEVPAYALTDVDVAEDYRELLAGHVTKS